MHPVVSFIVSLSIIVFVHEYGHYIVGKWTGIKADVFSVGMGPVILSRVDKNGTTWQIAAIPFGGFVKFYHIVIIRVFLFPSQAFFVAIWFLVVRVLCIPDRIDSLLRLRK